MEEPTDINQFDQSTLQNLLNNSAPTLIPESLVTTLTVGFIVLNVLGILFFIFFVINLIRKWKVESAVLHMQKDLAEIKTQLANQQPTPAKKDEPIVAPNPVEPASENKVIAAESHPSDDTRLS